jgi:hypothetical protein
MHGTLDEMQIPLGGGQLSGGPAIGRCHRSLRHHPVEVKRSS